jgi:hypothetical protein
MNAAHPIRHNFDTALWVAVYRVRERERADARRLDLADEQAPGKEE